MFLRTVKDIHCHLYYYTKVSSSVENSYLTFLLFGNILKMIIKYCKSNVMNSDDTRFLKHSAGNFDTGNRYWLRIHVDVSCYVCRLTFDFPA